MKTKNIILIFIILIFISCSKELDKANINPNQPPTTPASTLLTAGSERIASMLSSPLNMNYIDCWAQQFAKIAYIDEDRYYYYNGDIDDFWKAFYADILSNFEAEINMSAAENNTNMKAVGQIMKAFTFSIITDLWGDIPYFEALKGDSILTPKYDTQREIYFDLIAQLKICRDLLDIEKEEVKGDIIYNGDILKWKKFANSLLLRFYIRISKVEPFVAQQGIEEILSDHDRYPIFTGNSDNTKVSYLSYAPYENPLYTYKQTLDSHGVSKTLIDMMLQLNDPRLPVYALPADADGEYRGMSNGVDNYEIPQANTLSRIGSMFKDEPTAPSYLMQYSEVMFIIAEASLNGWNTNESASDAYENAIRASMNKCGVEMGDYMDNPSVNLDMVENQYEAVANQKWLALFTQGTEAFAEFHRTGYPSTIQEVPASIFPGLGVPCRLPYPNSEFSLNYDNVTKASLGIESFMFGKKMWWAK